MQMPVCLGRVLFHRAFDSQVMNRALHQGHFLFVHHAQEILSQWLIRVTFSKLDFNRYVGYISLSRRASTTWGTCAVGFIGADL